MDKKKKKGISRRTFIKSTAAAGAGAIVFTGTGCNKTDQSTSATEPFTSVTEPKKYSWETPPAPIPDSEIKEKFTSDIVIIGCGIAGATASASASEEGAKVIVIEKHTSYNSRGKDNAAIDSRFHKEKGIKVDKDEVCLALQKYGGNRTDQRLLRLWANNSGRIMDWISDKIEAAGFETTLPYWPEPEGYDTKTEYCPQFQVDHVFSCGQEGLVKTMIANAHKNGAEFRYNTRAVQLIRKNKGRVTGVIAQDKDGNYVQFNAKKGLILCTGEYGNNKEMMEAYCPWAVEEAKDTDYKPPVNTGDGHKMAMWIGGVLEPAPHPPMDHGGTPMGCSAFLHVNTLGERYENEDVDSQLIANGMKRQPGQTCWVVYDSKYEDELPKMGFGFMKGTDPAVSPVSGGAGAPGAPPGGAGAPGASPGGAGGAPGGEVDSPVFAAAAAAGAFGVPSGERAGSPPLQNKVQAYTLEELARKMKVPVDTFMATIERYNYLVRLGKDLDFGKRSDRLTTVDKPPYYAGDGGFTFLVVLGGLYVNPKLQLLDEERKPMGGIYLAGNTVGNRFAIDYTIMCPGLSHAFAWTTGYLAAKNAIAEKA